MRLESRESLAIKDFEQVSGKKIWGNHCVVQWQKLLQFDAQAVATSAGVSTAKQTVKDISHSMQLQARTPSAFENVVLRQGLTMSSWLAWNSQSCTCLCLLGVSIKGVRHQARSKELF